MSAYVVFAFGAFVLALAFIRLANHVRSVASGERCSCCGHRFSEWFTWPPGGRYCFLCWGPERWHEGPPPMRFYAVGERPERKRA